MPRPIEMVGKRFGMLVVVRRAEDHVCKGSGERKRRWECRCDCGNTTYATTGDLRKGDVKSCGCIVSEIRRRNSTKHGQSGTKLHNIWRAMRRRCTDKNAKDYKWYGGRGIRVCREWDEDFISFYEWAKSSNYVDGLTIDRIDSDGDYCPENCRWATVKEQCNNRTNNKTYTLDGETHTIAEWSEITGIPYSTLYMRLYNGWCFEDAIQRLIV